MNEQIDKSIEKLIIYEIRGEITNKQEYLRVLNYKKEEKTAKNVDKKVFANRRHFNIKIKIVKRNTIFPSAVPSGSIILCRKIIPSTAQ